jgi:hypothetical protein
MFRSRAQANLAVARSSTHLQVPCHRYV